VISVGGVQIIPPPSTSGMANPMTTLGEELASNPFLGFLRKERGIAGPPGVRWAPGL
jgi:hypothetical protein